MLHIRLFLNAPGEMLETLGSVSYTHLDGFEFRCDNGEKLRVTFALDCCDREALHWAVTTGGFDLSLIHI